MRKLLSISLLILFVFHNTSYFYIYKALQYKNEMCWQNKFVKDDFDHTQLQKASIPISFPYQPNEKEFQNVDERIELDGRIYRVIKKKYANDSLHILYVNDLVSQKIQHEYSKWAHQYNQNDLPLSASKSLSIIRILSNQYFQSDFLFRPLAIEKNKIIHHLYYVERVEEVYINKLFPPPKLSA